MDKIDGPYHFSLIQRMRQLLPPWMPAVAWRGRVNIVPVDFVVNAINVISHQKAIGEMLSPGGSGGYRVGDVLDIFSRAKRMRRA